MPHLLPAPQQMNGRNGDDEFAGVLLNEPTFDLPNLRPHRSTKRRATGVIEVQPNHGSQLWNWPPGGLQRVAAPEENSKSSDAKPTKRQHGACYHPYPLLAATEFGAFPAPTPAP